MKSDVTAATIQTGAGSGALASTRVKAALQAQAHVKVPHLTSHERRNVRLPLRPSFLPHRYRNDLIALAAFYRETRTLGLAAGTVDGCVRLDAWEASVRHMTDIHRSSHPVLIALAAAHLPTQPLLDLIEAQRMRAKTTSYATHIDLIRYCALAANPLGRLVLAMFGDEDFESAALSDALCTALLQTQLWRDVSRDYVRGRVYLPQEDMRLFGVAEEGLAEAVRQRRAGTNVRALIAYEVERTHYLLAQGALIANVLHRRARLDCALLVADGQAMLAAIAKQGYDPFSRRPTIGKLERSRAIIQSIHVLGALHPHG